MQLPQTSNRRYWVAVPWMVVGSPGMEGPADTGRKGAYPVQSIQCGGQTPACQKYD